jgi:transcriptional regulator with XRE-family HTH domain
VASLPHASEFGSLLRHWRRTRGISQLELADRAGMSTRHLSFLETGRCGPSRGTVLQLGRVLGLPRSETERLLLVAGWAGDWTRRSPDSDGIRRQLAKISHLLDAHDPFPAFISDPEWCLAGQNAASRAWFDRMRELSPGLRSDPVDLRQVLSDERSFARIVRNRSELLKGVVAGLYQLAPDPVSFGNARSLMDVLPDAGEPGDAIEQAARSTGWEHTIRVGDLGAEFSLEIFSLPFAGPASGFALVLVRPADAVSWNAARGYFQDLLGRTCSGTGRAARRVLPER